MLFPRLSLLSFGEESAQLDAFDGDNSVSGLIFQLGPGEIVGGEYCDNLAKRLEQGTFGLDVGAGHARRGHLREAHGVLSVRIHCDFAVHGVAADRTVDSLFGRVEDESHRLGSRNFFAVDLSDLP